MLTRALAWKEWREQRPLVITGVATALALPLFLIAGSSSTRRGMTFAEVSDMLPAILAALCWPLLAAAAGAGTIANEIGDGTLGFLLSRPATRVRVWLVKVAMALAAILAIVIGSLVVAWIFSLIAGGHDPGTALGDGLIRGTGGALGVVALAGVILMLFAASTFFSTFVGRPLTAAAAGIIASVAVLAGLFFISTRLELFPRLEPGLLAWQIALSSAAILLGSLAVFARGEMVGRRGILRATAIGAPILLMALLAGVLPAVYAAGRLAPANAMLPLSEAVLTESSLVTTVMDENGGSPQIWRIHLDGSGFERLTGRLTFAPSVSVDGAHMAYISMRSSLGLRSDRPELRVSSLSGGGDRRAGALGPMPWPADPFMESAVSPDGGRAALLGRRSLLLADLRTGLSLTPALPAPVLPAGCSLLGWSRDGSSLVVLSRGDRRSAASLHAIDAETGKMRLLRQSEEQGNLPGYILSLGRRNRVWTTVPVVDRGRLMLIDVDTSVARPAGDSPCVTAADVTDDGRLLAYAACDPESPRTATLIRLHDAVTGADRPVARVTGRAWQVILSPSGSQILVGRRVMPDKGPLPPALVSRSGEVTELEAGWVAVGWFGNDRALLADDDVARRLAVLDPGAGSPRIIYP